MEQDKALKLLLRQLKDIQAQAQKITQGEDSNEALENFSRYATELKAYIKKNVDVEEIRNYLNEIPEINFSRIKIKLWQYLLLPNWWLGLYKNYQARKKTIEEINIVSGKYATLELLIRGLTN